MLYRPLVRDGHFPAEIYACQGLGGVIEQSFEAHLVLILGHRSRLVRVELFNQAAERARLALPIRSQ